MTPEAALAAGVAALWLRAPLVMWLTLTLLLCVDRRRVISVACSLIALLCAAASLADWARPAATGLGTCSIVSGCCALAMIWIALRAWLSTKDAFQSRSLALAMASLGVLFSGCVVIQPLASYALIPLEIRVLAVAHGLASTLALASLIVTSLELAFLTSPDTLLDAARAKVGWRIIGWVALAALAVEILLCSFIFLQPAAAETDPLATALLTRGFALALLVAQFVAWMIPHRLTAFQQSGKIVVGWLSLTLAAWLAALALAVVCALPSTWPWKEL